MECKNCNKILTASHRTMGWNKYTKGLLVFATLFAVIQDSHAFEKVETNDIQSLLATLDNAQKTVPKQLKLDLQDAKATIGKLFTYSFPQDFEQEVIYKVTEAGKDTLPPWLFHDVKSSSIKGVASKEQLGQHYIEVTATQNGKNKEDVFSIYVVDSSHAPSPSLNSIGDTPKPIHCQTDKPVTVVTVILDTDFSKMTPAERIAVLSKMSSHLTLAEDFLSFQPSEDKPLFDNSALVTGQGDTKQPKTQGAFVTWHVGCGNVDAFHMPILQKLESTSQNGNMKSAVGHPVVGWHITASKPQKMRRKKRQAKIQATATLVTTAAPPTKLPVNTVIIEESSVDIMTPEVPQPSSPGTSGKHHPRTKTAGRHMHTKTAVVKPSSSTKATTTSSMEMVATPVVPTPEESSTTPVMKVTTGETPKITPSAQTTTVTTPKVPDIVVEPSASEPAIVTPKATETLESSTEVVVVPTKVTTKSSSKPSTTTPSTEEPKIVTLPPKAECAPDESPKVKNHIRIINARVGEVLNYTVPEDIFYDCVDGNTRQLKLVCLSEDGLTIQKTSWIQFNQQGQYIYGLPTVGNIGKELFTISAINKKGKIAHDTFTVEVEDIPSDKLDEVNHEFSVQLELDYDHFVNDVEKRIDVTAKIAKAFGDDDPSAITVINLRPGSVYYGWTNNTVSTSPPCPVKVLSELVSRLITTSNKTLNANFVKAMRPYSVLYVSLEPKGNCKESFRQIATEPSATTSPPAVGDDTQTSEDEILITTVIPASVIAAMLLLAGIIACILYRKRRKGKLSDEDQNTFINKGIPIIFADELEDKPDPPTKPLIMEDEKPPMPPPDYHGRSSASGSTPSTPPSDHKPSIEADDDEDVNAPLYQPPPPVYSARENGRNRPKASQQTYRSPPAYVPP